LTERNRRRFLKIRERDEDGDDGGTGDEIHRRGAVRGE